MSAARKHLQNHIRTCLSSEGNVKQVVAYDDALTALNIQKACMLSFFKGFLGKVVLAQTLGYNMDWNRIIEEQTKEL